MYFWYIFLTYLFYPVSKVYLFYRKLNKNELAISAISKGIELRPEYANAHYNLGIIYAEEGQFDKAKEKCQNVLQIDPDDQEAQNAINILDKKIK